MTLKTIDVILLIVIILRSGKTAGALTIQHVLIQDEL